MIYRLFYIPFCRNWNTNCILIIRISANSIEITIRGRGPDINKILLQAKKQQGIALAEVNSSSSMDSNIRTRSNSFVVPSPLYFMLFIYRSILNVENKLFCDFPVLFFFFYLFSFLYYITNLFFIIYTCFYYKIHEHKSTCIIGRKINYYY